MQAVRRARRGVASQCCRHVAVARVLSGIQPTGVPHVGNYLGALRQWAALQREEGAELMYMVVDLHAMTVPFEPAALRRQSRQTAAALMACGVDPRRSALFKQSEVFQHAELNWVLGCFCSVGQMRRMTQFKDKSRDSQSGAPLGLFAYPVLQAADILLYRATHVPVGEDQRQHLELCRDVAQRVNDFAGEALFPPPEAYMVRGRGCRVMSLRDPTRKMSKSDAAPASRIDLTDDADAIRRKIARAVTDSEPAVSFDPETRPGVSNLVSLLATLTDRGEDDVVASMRGLRCSDLKAALTEGLVDTLGPIAAEMRRLEADPGAVDEALDAGAQAAAEEAEATMTRVRRAMGLSRQ